MEQLYGYLGSHSLWDVENRDCTPLQTIEIWYNRDTGKLVRRSHGPKAAGSHDLAPGKADAFRDDDDGDDDDDDDDGDVERCLFSAALASSPGSRRDSVGMDGVSPTVDRLGLRLAYDYSRSCATGIEAITTQEEDGNTRTNVLVYHPKLAAIWKTTTEEEPRESILAESEIASAPSAGPLSHNAAGEPLIPSCARTDSEFTLKASEIFGSSSSSESHTQAIILAAPQEYAQLQTLLEIPWEERVVSHTMFPALICGLVLNRCIDETQTTIKVAVRQTEVRTGHHRFASRCEPAAPGDLADLSASMSGYATKLASTGRKIRVAREIQAFMLQHARAGNASESAARLIEHHARVVDKRLDMQMLENDFLLERVKIQLNAIFNLISQKNSLVGLQIARTSQLTAQSSLLDSSSMRTLALVALLFLPGNFVAALFSTPIFDWEGDGSPADSNGIGIATKPQFNLFWAITVPLTVSVFILYVGWWQVRRRQWRKLTQDFDTRTQKAMFEDQPSDTNV